MIAIGILFLIMFFLFSILNLGALCVIADRLKDLNKTLKIKK